jgi:hypothetical protein
VPELIVPWAAELGAGRVEVMQVALDAHPVRDACRIPVIIQRVPVSAWKNNAGVGRLFDDAVRSCGKKNTDHRLFYLTTCLSYIIIITIFVIIIIHYSMSWDNSIVEMTSFGLYANRTGSFHWKVPSAMPDWLRDPLANSMEYTDSALRNK